MSQTSKIFCLALPNELRLQIDAVVSGANKYRGTSKNEQLSRAQFIRDCVVYVIRQIEDGEMFIE